MLRWAGGGRDSVFQRREAGTGMDILGESLQDIRRDRLCNGWVSKAPSLLLPSSLISSYSQAVAALGISLLPKLPPGTRTPEAPSVPFHHSWVTGERSTSSNLLSLRLQPWRNQPRLDPREEDSPTAPGDPTTQTWIQVTYTAPGPHLPPAF